MKNLIWLVGLPRSGTSWLGKIFDSHPDTAYRSEPDNAPKLREVPLFPAPGDTKYYEDSIRKLVLSLPRLDTYGLAAKPPIFTKSYRPGVRHHLYRAAALTARVGGRVRADFPVIGARVDRIHPSPVLIWKSINSLGRLGLVQQSLEDIKTVHLVRHPCGHIASVLRGEKQADFGSSDPHSEWYGVFEKLLQTPQARRRGLTVKQLRDLTPEERLAWHWVLVNEKAAEEGDDLEQARLVRYEDICEHPLAATRELFQFADLAWNRQTEDFINQSTTQKNARYYSVFKDPAKAAQRWRKELSQAHIDRIMAIVCQSERLSALYYD